MIRIECHERTYKGLWRFCTSGDFIAARANRKRHASFPCIQFIIAYAAYWDYALVYAMMVMCALSEVPHHVSREWWVV